MTPADPNDELEARLLRRPLPELPARLRDRVFDEVERIPESAPVIGWRFAAGLAATVLVGLNLALMAANSPTLPRFTLPQFTSLASLDASDIAPRFGAPWIPCDLPGRR